ncbi:Adaptive-response sensory-kinase SasA [bioreactor metagenome]|uniref:histidine kinase n=1 Tax=bioreactor metagenome TaxID=1076179 RepID=A0A645J9F1_9ZZZZ
MSVVPYVESKEIDIVFDTDVEEKVMAFDHDNLERIILNLISNAVKFTEAKGKIEVSVEDKGNHVEVRVKDNGIGIPKDKLDIIFERFKQVEYPSSNPSQGSGIGLFLVKGLVEAHGGTITVHSTIGEGSEFIINLPVIVLAEEEIASENELKLDNNGKITLEFSSVQ